MNESLSVADVCAPSSQSLQGEPASTELATYQSIESQPPPPGKMERLHLIDSAECKGAFKGWALDENNMIAGTRALHERFDGMNTTERIPPSLKGKFKADHMRLPSVAVRAAAVQELVPDPSRANRCVLALLLARKGMQRLCLDSTSIHWLCPN